MPAATTQNSNAMLVRDYNDKKKANAKKAGQLAAIRRI